MHFALLHFEAMAFPVPTLRRVCVLKIVKDIKEFCPGISFGDLGQYQFIVGPFEYLSSTCIEAVFNYVISTRQLDTSWLSLLVVTHLRTIDFSAYPSAVNVSLFKLLKQRCKLLEQLIIPSCKKIPNKALCDVLELNPSLLYLDISNKVSPKVDTSVVRTVSHSCRFLRVLKLSDYRVEDPKCLLVLCGKVILPNSASPKAAKTTVTHTTESSSLAICQNREENLTCSNTDRGEDMSERHQSDERELSTARDCVVPDLARLSCLQDFVKSKPTANCPPSHSSIVFCHNELSSPFLDQPSSYYDSKESDMSFGLPTAMNGCSSQDPSPMDYQDVSTLMEKILSMEGSSCEQASDLAHLNHATNEADVVMLDHKSDSGHPVCCRNNGDAEEYHTSRQQPHCFGNVPSGVIAGSNNIQRVPTREEHQNQLARRERLDNVDVPDTTDHDSSVGASEGDGDEDLYENDDPILPLKVKDCSSEFGCVELETLWLDNVNLDDQVCAVLLQSLPHLRDLNLSDTDICNPWRLLDSTQSVHLRLLQHLDVKSTALSRTALEMIPKFHPDLRKFSISSTTLPPHTYANIGKLTGVADLELIGGQFYPSEPAEIFEKGIAPAVGAIGVHLRSLNLTYFAHVNFEVIVLNCPGIEHLDLSFTSISVSYPCVSLGDCCPQLVSLNLGFSHIDAKEGVGDDLRPVSAEKALEKMMGQPKVLEELDVSGLIITDGAVQSIFPLAVYPLCSLNMSRCPRVTIAGVQHIWERCPHLRTIDITHCREITLADYQNFKRNCYRTRPVFKVEGILNWI